MVEVMEYLLVFAVTAAIAGFSIFVFNGSVPGIRQTQGQAEVDQVAGAVELAAANGNATLTLPLSGASLSCSQGVVELTSDGQTYSSYVSSGCAFSVSGLSCVCSLSFTWVPDGVGMEVAG